MSKTPVSKDPKFLVEQIAQFIGKAKAHVAEGADVDLAGLDEHVQLLCERILELPASEATEYRKYLQDISDELGELKTGLLSAQDSIRGQIQELNARHKAAKAYKTGKATSAPSKPEKEGGE